MQQRTVPAMIAAMAILGGIPGPRQAPAAPDAPSPAPDALGDTPQARAAQARAILDRAEQADRDAQTLSAQIRFIAVKPLVGDTETRTGSMALGPRVRRSDGAETSVRKMSVRFTELRLGSRLEDGPEAEQIITFDGRKVMLMEPGKLRAEVWHVVGPDEEVDAFEDIGQGRFWMPVSRPAGEVLRRFEAERIATGQMPELDAGVDLPLDSLRSFVSGCVQVRLVPIEGAGQERSWREIRVWYDPATWHTRAAIAIERDEEWKIAMLRDVTLDAELPPRAFVVAPPKEFDVVERPWREGTEP